MKTIMTLEKKGLPNKVHIVELEGGRRTVMAEYNQGWLTDWPIRDGSRILYDHPYQVPQYVKDLVRRAFNMIALWEALHN